MKKVFSLVATVVLATAVLTGCGNNNPPNVPSSVANVNGKPIQSKKYLTELSAKFGKEMITSLIEQQILMGWAEKEKVPVTDQQVNKQIEILKKRGVYDDQVALLGEDTFKSELEAMQARANIATKLYKIDDKQLESLYNASKDQFTHGAMKKLEIIVSPEKSKMDEALKELKAGTTFDEAAAKYLTSPFGPKASIKVWIDEKQKGRIPENIVAAVSKTDLNSFGEVVELPGGTKGAPSQFMVFKVVATRPAEDISFKDAKEELTYSAALQRAQTDPDFQAQFDKEKKDAKIDINIKEFKDISYKFKYPAQPMPQMMGMPGQQR